MLFVGFFNRSGESSIQLGFFKSWFLFQLQGDTQNKQEQTQAEGDVVENEDLPIVL